MGVIKQTHIVAKEIAEDIIKQINKQCDWQVDQFLPPNSEGKIIDDTHSYMARTVARHVANAFDVTTNPINAGSNARTRILSIQIVCI